MENGIPPIRTRGLLNLASTGPLAKELTEKLLYEDYVKNHCFMDNVGLHNHLSHHLLAAYDLGAPPVIIQAIFDAEMPEQRGLNIPSEAGESPPDITDENWKQWLGKPTAYAAYLAFFSARIMMLGVGKTLENYIFSVEANHKGVFMLVRFMSSVFHAFIQVGYGMEFGIDSVTAQGLAQAAVNLPGGFQLVELPSALPNSAHGAGPSLLALLRQMYDSDILAPDMPYEPNTMISEKLRRFISNPTRPAEIRRIFDQWAFDDSLGDVDIDAKVEEIIWQSTLLLASTGLKEGKAPRLDFFLMHVLTSAAFLPSIVKSLPTFRCKELLLQAHVRVTALLLMLRGRPRIDIPRLMRCPTYPALLATASLTPEARALGIGAPADVLNPWVDIIQDALHHPEAHVAKSLRTFYYAAQRYGTTKAGSAPGVLDAAHQETHPGAMLLDGSVFLRAAVLMMDVLGWVNHGQEPSDWDKSALGWDDAWKTDASEN